MIYIHKILPLLTAPLFIALILVIAGILRKKISYSIFGVLILGLFSNSFFSDWAATIAEKPYSPVKIVSLQKSDFVVVLSGDIDRFRAAAAILDEGKADKMIVTGGRTPWENKELNDGEYYISISNQYGIDQSQILITGTVQNTEQEAREVQKIVPHGSKVILVTSAFHMTRSMMLFSKYDFDLTAYPIKFFSPQKTTLMKFIPSSAALHRSSGIYREFQGRFFYMVKSVLGS